MLLPIVPIPTSSRMAMAVTITHSAATAMAKSVNQKTGTSARRTMPATCPVRPLKVTPGATTGAWPCSAGPSGRPVRPLSLIDRHVCSDNSGFGLRNSAR